MRILRGIHDAVHAARHEAARSSARAMRFSLPLMMILTLGLQPGCETVGVDEQRPNRAPNTVFDDLPGSPTPAPDTLLQVSTVTLRWTGTDMDGDYLVSYYRLSPRDTIWTRTTFSQPGTVTFHDLPDGDYEFCVYVVDEHGLADPEPVCRRFSVDVYRVGQIVVLTDTTRWGDYRFTWELRESEIPPDSLRFFIWPVIYDLGSGDVIEIGVKHETTASDTIVTPEAGRRYCISVFAQHRADSTIAPAPLRSCIPPF